ncbi:MAG: copper resistance protein NlpE [Methyloglobulus sp.]|nr:copper resistance protein NlpE [Methyloglobulus sp.]
MLTFKQKTKSFLAFLLVAFVCLSCNPVFAETAGNTDAQPIRKSLNLSGLYLGFFPCADCQGIRTTLALNQNNNYVLITIYVGKSDREFVEKGKFTLTETGDKLVLTPRKGSTTTQEYLIDDDMLIKLDEDGNRITSDGADRFILRRKDVMKAPGNQHSGH